MTTVTEIDALKYETDYALKAQCPNMLMFGIKILTSRGCLELSDKEAPLVVEAIKQVLTARLATLATARLTAFA
ncbi:MAG: hypothetical protein LBQ75_02690 [Zoogloeaceae bacterium]|jgi:hypothetical protein|nr:hypothetical protein [Zoogloeaceae bacterium]